MSALYPDAWDEHAFEVADNPQAGTTVLRVGGGSQPTQAFELDRGPATNLALDLIAISSPELAAAIRTITGPAKKGPSK